MILCMFFVPDDIENEIRINMIDDKILRTGSFVVHLTISVDATEKP